MTDLPASLDNLTLGQLKALSAMIGGRKAGPSRVDHGRAIVILTAGHVWIGDVVTDGDWVCIANGNVIRRWGTSKGLAQLAAEGPTPNTKLDMLGDAQAPMSALIGIIPCKR